MKKWEADIENKRKEFKKSLPQLEERKKELIKLKLSEIPLLELEELEKNLKENGLLGMSLKEKVDVTRNQIALLLAKYQHLLGKINRFKSFSGVLCVILRFSGQSEEKRGKRTRKIKGI